MQNTRETTLVSLFNTDEQARSAMSDLQRAGIPAQSIQTLGGTSETSAPEASLATLQGLSLPPQDLQILASGLKNGGTVLVVRAAAGLADQAENIFEAHSAGKVDELRAQTAAAAAAGNTGAIVGERVIPVVEEDLVVGKRTVERGGVRVFTRLVETPVEEQVSLREERATFERHAVNRPISEAELSSLQDQAIEIREMGEEPVVAKTARVVEEVHVGKDATERTEQIRDSVRKTQVEVDQIAADSTTTDATRQNAMRAKNS